jgi:GT2 family glycosyltransferase
MDRPLLAVAITAFNRRAQTLACLKTLRACTEDAGVRVAVCLTDDGSTDGTADAVRADYPEVRIIQGTGALFWCGGMRRAMDEARALRPDWFLWLNDDVTLFPGAVARMLQTARAAHDAQGAEAIVVGATVDPSTGRTTYGGRVRRRGPRLAFDLVEPGSAPLRCETMNANCVLLARPVVDALGNLDGAFVHGLGDLDYGLRASQRGIPVLLCPGHVGACVGGTERGDRAEAFRSARAAWRAISGPKALPPAAWRTFTRRHAGPLWPLYWIKPYAGALLRGLARGGI